MHFPSWTTHKKPGALQRPRGKRLILYRPRERKVNFSPLKYEVNAFQGSWDFPSYTKASPKKGSDQNYFGYASDYHIINSRLSAGKRKRLWSKDQYFREGYSPGKGVHDGEEPNGVCVFLRLCNISGREDCILRHKAGDDRGCNECLSQWAGIGV